MRNVTFFKGLLMGLGMGFASIIIGILLSLTGIGMLLGIPMILIGLFFGLTSPIAFKYMKIADCPYCQGEIFIPLPRKHIKCKNCKHKYLVKKDGVLLAL